MSGGPGKSHRKGVSLLALFDRFPNDAAAEKFFADMRWPSGPECPKCGSGNVLTGAKHKTMPYQCRACRKKFSVKFGTVMEGSNIGYRKWLIAMYLMQTSLKSVSAMKLHRDLDISHKSAWFMAHRLRESFKDVQQPFLGPVEADETYMGGVRKNMPKKKRETLKGRGGVGKTVVVGVKDRRTNQVSAAVIEETDAHSLQTFIEDRVDIDAKVFTDDHTGYLGMIFDHDTVKHSAGEYVKGDTHTNGIESFWSMLKRAHKGTFHKLSPKHMDRYVTEFTGRHNVRGLDTEDQMKELLVGMAGRRLKYDDLIRPNGLDNMARGG